MKRNVDAVNGTKPVGTRSLSATSQLPIINVPISRPCILLLACFYRDSRMLIDAEIKTDNRMCNKGPINKR